VPWPGIEQEARIRLWRALQSEREITDLASYIYKIAVTATIDAVRRAKARREEPLPEGPSEDDREGEMTLPSRDTSPEDEAAGQSMARAVDSALSKIAESRRRPVALYLKGLTTTEIGRVMGWTEAKARNLVYRGLGDLRRELKKMGIDYDNT
jgi:RNA polymerase sigma-70 factor (ECF subfamily)